MYSMKNSNQSTYSKYSVSGQFIASESQEVIILKITALLRLDCLKGQLHLILLFLAELFDNDCVKEYLTIKMNVIDTH